MSSYYNKSAPSISSSLPPYCPERNALCSMFGAMMKMTATAVKRLASESAKKTKLLYDSCVMVDFCELS